MNIHEYENYIENLPRASHEMEHITNFGRLIGKGFVLIASTIERVFDGVDPEAARARRTEQRKAEAKRLREQAAALDAEIQAENAA